MMDKEEQIEQEAQLDDACEEDEEEQKDVEEDQRQPIFQEVRKALEFAHRQVRHPARTIRSGC